MTTKNERIYITPTPEFRAWLESYAKENKISSLAEALVELAKPEARKRGFIRAFMLPRGKYLRSEKQRDIAQKESNIDALNAEIIDLKKQLITTHDLAEHEQIRLNIREAEHHVDYLGKQLARLEGDE